MFSSVLFQAHRSPIPYTPLCLAKAVKNATEIQCMKTAHVGTFEPCTRQAYRILSLWHWCKVSDLPHALLSTDQRCSGALWTLCMVGKGGIFFFAWGHNIHKSQTKNERSHRCFSLLLIDSQFDSQNFCIYFWLTSFVFLCSRK